MGSREDSAASRAPRPPGTPRQVRNQTDTHFDPTRPPANQRQRDLWLAHQPSERWQSRFSHPQRGRKWRPNRDGHPRTGCGIQRRKLRWIQQVVQVGTPVSAAIHHPGALGTENSVSERPIDSSSDCGRVKFLCAMADLDSKRDRKGKERHAVTAGNKSLRMNFAEAAGNKGVSERGRNRIRESM